MYIPWTYRLDHAPEVAQINSLQMSAPDILCLIYGHSAWLQLKAGAQASLPLSCDGNVDIQTRFFSRNDPDKAGVSVRMWLRRARINETTIWRHCIKLTDNDQVPTHSNEWQSRLFSEDARRLDQLGQIVSNQRPDVDVGCYVSLDHIALITIIIIISSSSSRRRRRRNSHIHRDT